MKPDEKLLLQLMIKRGEAMTPSAWEIAQSIDMPYKRARYIFRDKWTGKDWYNYGVSWRVGWMEEEFLLKVAVGIAVGILSL